MKKTLGVMMLILSLGVMGLPPTYAQDDGNGDDEITYQPVEFPEIGVSLEIPDNWQAELNDGELGGLKLNVPEYSGEYNGINFIVDPYSIELLFLPADISGDFMTYTTDTESFVKALSAEFFLHANDEVDTWSNFDTNEDNNGASIIPIYIRNNNELRSYEYFILADSGIIWFRSKQSIFTGFSSPADSVLVHMLDTLSIDWSLARYVDEFSVEELFAFIGIEYINKYELTENETTSFTINSKNENKPSQTYTNLEWTSGPPRNGKYTSYGEALATASSFDLELKVPDEEMSVTLEKLPLDIQVGIYQTAYKFNFNSGSSSGSSAYVIIESVTEEGLSGQFFFEGWGNQFFYGRFVNISIPNNEDCFALGSPKDSAVKLSIDMVDDELAQLEFVNQNAYWFVERQPSRYADDLSQADVYLRFSPTPDGTSLNLTVTLRPSYGATVGTYSNPTGNPQSIGEASVTIVLNERTFSSIEFVGDIVIDRFDDRVSGYIEGNLIYYLTDDLYLTLGTVHGEFNNLVVPTFNCEVTSVATTPSE